MNDAVSLHQDLASMIAALRDEWDRIRAEPGIGMLDNDDKLLFQEVVRSHLARLEESNLALSNVLELMQINRFNHEALLSLTLWT